MTKKTTHKKVLLIGDAAWDRYVLQVPVHGGDKDEDWLYHRRWISWDKPGGAFMTLEMLTQSGIATDAIIPNVAQGDIDAQPVTHSLAQLTDIASSGTKSASPVRRLRIGHLDGYSTIVPKYTYKDLSKFDPETDYDLIVVNDAGSTLRKSPTFWQDCHTHLSALTGPAPRALIYKMHLPLAAGELWEKFTALPIASKVVHVHAEDLRRENILLSRGLSWARLREDLSVAVKSKTGVLADLMAAATTVIVQFHDEALAVIDCKTAQPISTLVYDNTVAEMDLNLSSTGTMVGKMNCVLAALTTYIEQSGPGDLVAGAKQILLQLQAFANGYFTLQGETIELPNIGPKSARPLRTLTLDQATVAFSTDDVLAQAIKVVRDGPESLQNYDIGQFGDLITTNETEIDGLRAINRIFDKYMTGPRPDKPISIAVFGPPGAGKSFGVKQLLKGKALEEHEFNLSEMQLPELHAAFHKIRDTNLEGKLPLCFFDEFDSDNLSWLIRFLAPMQDGKFRDTSGVHPVGAGIFVFAGGVHQNFKKFRELAPDDNIKKKPDFISRLSGHIDVLGPNRDDNEPSDSIAYILRRALLLRSILKRDYGQILRSSSDATDILRAEIDETLVRAFLTVDRYHNGARSMERLLGMFSHGPDSDRLMVSDMPERKQMSLCVDPDKFTIIR